MEGENFVTLVGKLMYPSLKNVGEKNTSLLNAKLAIPTSNGGEKNQYVKISAWGSTALNLGSIAENTFIKIHGHIEERSYDGRCKHCGGTDKRYWTSVVVDQFVPIA
jgi:hypothetical protein